MTIVVTTVLNPSSQNITDVQELATLIGALPVQRGIKSLETIKAEFDAICVIVIKNTGPIAYTARGKYFFHLSMAELRLKNLLQGKPDHMVDAMGLKPGMTVLDCTLGLASDAIVASHITGSDGFVLGLESAAVIAAITSQGLQQFVCDDPEITPALRRIQVLQTTADDYLASLPDNSFDIVYFDPMFRIPLKRSSNVNVIRDLADHRSVSCSTVAVACRVAKLKVVIKESRQSEVLQQLRPHYTVGGKYSRVVYGIWEAGDSRPWND